MFNEIVSSVFRINTNDTMYVSGRSVQQLSVEDEPARTVEVNLSDRRSSHLSHRSAND